MLKNFNFRQPVNNSHVNDIQQDNFRIHLKTDISIFIQFYGKYLLEGRVIEYFCNF